MSGFAEAVGERLGLPITEERLSTLTVTDLREILAGNHAEEDCKVGVSPETLKQAVRLLWGEGMPYSELPPVEPYVEGSLRVRFAWLALRTMARFSTGISVHASAFSSIRSRQRSRS